MEQSKEDGAKEASVAEESYSKSDDSEKDEERNFILMIFQVKSTLNGYCYHNLK
jgi:hypothetical protein